MQVGQGQMNDPVDTLQCAPKRDKDPFLGVEVDTSQRVG